MFTVIISLFTVIISLFTVIIRLFTVIISFYAMDIKHDDLDSFVRDAPFESSVAEMTFMLLQAILTCTAVWAGSVDDKLMILFFIFTRK